MKPHVVIALMAISSIFLGYAEAKNRLNGIPFYQIYEEKDIENTSRANFITTSPDGQLYFGSEQGLHTFDGTSWKLVIETPTTQSKIRAIAWTEDGVFASGYGTIGKLIFKDETGFEYLSLNSEPLSTYASEFYSKIHQLENLIYFIGERSVAYYDLNTKEIGAIPFESWLKGSAIIDGKLHVANARDGMIVFDGIDHFNHPAFKQFVDKHVILKIEAYKNGECYFATENNDLYHVPPGQPISSFESFPYEAEGAIRDLEFVGENQLAISVGHKGIHFINRDGQTTSALEIDSDYRWVGANALHLDKHHTLWVQFNSTIGKVIITSPLSQIDERLTMGVDYPIAFESDGELYLKTNNKLLKPQFNANGSMQGFVDTFPEIEKSIITACETSQGLYFQGGQYTYLYSDGKSNRIAKTGYIERLRSFKNNSHRLLAATPDEILVLEHKGESITQLYKTKHQVGHVNKIARADDDVFWLEIGLGQLGRVSIKEGQLDYRLYNTSAGLPEDWVAVWEHEGEVLFTSSSGIFEYNPQTESFHNTDILDAYLPPEGIFHRVATDPNGNIWASYDKFNYILWKQEDGTYIKDDRSLIHASDQYFNHFKFLSKGDAILLTATELYHVDGSKLPPVEQFQTSNLHLLEISDIEGSSIYYQSSGSQIRPNRLEFDSSRRSLSIRVGNTSSTSIKTPQYQYLLDQVSNNWSKWSTSNEVNFTKLDAGDHTLRVRSRENEASAPSEISIAFSIAPTFWETPFAFILYFIILLFLLNFGYNFFAKNLRRTNEKLELMVNERTKEIERKNSELQLNANELTYALNELRSAQDLLMNASRKAGMAEVATNVLHNVGNVLNSINVAVLSLSERLSQERVSKLVRVTKMLNEHDHDLAGFLTSDPKGKAIPAYLTQLSSVLTDDYSHYRVEVECMHENIEHVKKIIATQQSHAKTVEVLQPVKIEELIEDSLEMITGDLEHSLFEIVRDFEPDLEITSDKHSLLQMVTNFIKNAKESIIEADKELGLITISAHVTDDKSNVRIQISDNGMGISKENERKIFTHGFTTKSNGHGFGMHSSANAAKSLGGDLQINSEGLGKGATVTLTLPLSGKRKLTEAFSEQSSFSRN